MPLFDCEVVEARAFPTFADHAAMIRSLKGSLSVGGPETVMVSGHDPAQRGEAAVLPNMRASARDRRLAPRG
jgi:hypothetical protein